MSEPAANGQDGAATQGPVLIINAQYVRDLSFENPRAPESLMGQNAPPEVGVEIDVKARQISLELFEVVLSFQVQARTGDDVAFLIELDYGAVLTIRNAAPEMIAALLLVEAPRILFPFARAIISNATRDGGFPPLLLNPVDFADLQRRKAQQAQQASDTAQA
jgi:preprotein translocase subunit SecB